jgi:hypothetical protein
MSQGGLKKCKRIQPTRTKDNDFTKLAFRDLISAYNNMYEAAQEYSTMIPDEKAFAKMYEMSKQQEKIIDKIEDEVGRQEDRKQKMEKKMGIEDLNEQWDVLDSKIAAIYDRTFTMTPENQMRIHYMNVVDQLEERKTELDEKISQKQQSDPEYVSLLELIEKTRISNESVKQTIMQDILAKIYKLQQEILDMEQEIGVDMGPDDKDFNADEEFEVKMDEEEDSDSDEDVECDEDGECDEDSKFESRDSSQISKKKLMSLAETLSVEELKTILNKKGIKRYLVLSK